MSAQNPFQRRESTPDDEASHVADISEHYREIIASLGEDVNREGLVDTPKRAAKAMRFLTRGYRQNLDELINNAVFTSDTDEMVIVRTSRCIPCASTTCCPSSVKCHVAYLPQGKVLGLSKIARIVDYFSPSADPGSADQADRRVRDGSDRRPRRRRDHRSQAHVHDDAWCREAELDDDYVLHARQFPERAGHP